MPGIGHSITLDNALFHGNPGLYPVARGRRALRARPGGRGDGREARFLQTGAGRAPDRRVAAADGADGVTWTPAATHVMVVEDDRDTREVVKLLLEMEGMGVIEASDGFEALHRLHSAAGDRSCRRARSCSTS